MWGACHCSSERRDQGGLNAVTAVALQLGHNLALAGNVMLAVRNVALGGRELRFEHDLVHSRPFGRFE